MFFTQEERTAWWSTAPESVETSKMTAAATSSTRSGICEWFGDFAKAEIEDSAGFDGGVRAIPGLRIETWNSAHSFDGG
jgi:hypothetical protein